MKIGQKFTILLISVFGYLNLSSQDMREGYWSESRFSEGNFEFENDAPNNFVLIAKVNKTNYVMVECKIDSPHKLKKGEEFPITFFSVIF